MKRLILATSANWPGSNFWRSMDEYIDEEAWDKYLSEPENTVENQKQISVQSNFKSVYINDESVNDNNPIIIDFIEWCDAEICMAMEANSVKDYEKLYADYIDRCIKSANWKRRFK